MAKRYTHASLARALDHHMVGGAVRGWRRIEGSERWLVDLAGHGPETFSDGRAVYALCLGLAAAEHQQKRTRPGPIARKGERVRVSTTNGGEIEGVLLSTFRAGQGVRVDVRDWTPDRVDVEGFVPTYHRHTTDGREHAHPDGASPHRHHGLDRESVVEVEALRIREVVSIDA